jgi:leucyl aminopeptidase
MKDIYKINFTISNQIDYKYNTTVYINHTDENINLSRHLKKIIKISSEYDTLIRDIQYNFKVNPKQEAIIIINRPEEKDKYHKIIIIGCHHPLGSESNISQKMDNYRVIGQKILKGMKHNQLNNVNIVVPTTVYNLEAVLEGLFLSSYQFNNYKTKNRIDNLNIVDQIFDLQNIHLVSNLKNNTLVLKKIDTLKNKIYSVFYAKNLINEPPNILNPNSFIKNIQTTIKKHNLPIKVDVLDTAKLKKMKMNLILSVGQSSTKNTARLLILKYLPNKKKNIDYVLLGKGVTYDSGGISLKKYKGLHDSKYDMAGAATVVSSLMGSVLNKCEKNIVVYCPLVENKIGSSSYRIGDVVTSYSGTTVEIDDTDAEGRLIMADCLSHIVETYPKSKIIDVATLTGQQESISCKLFTSLLGTNNTVIANKILKIGNEINEKIMIMPIHDELNKKLESNIADIKNSSEKCAADLMLSTLFLKHFIKKNTNWTHLDIAGSSLLSNDDIPYINGESSGIGVRLLLELL